MGVFWTGLATVLGFAAKPILFRILLALGIGIASFAGSQAVLGQIENLFLGQFANLPVNVVNTLGLLNVDEFISMILSAFAFRITYQQTVKWVKIPES